MKSSDYFQIREIWVQPSLRFLESSRILALQGKNLLDVDLKKIERQLQIQYPQVSNLRLMRRFPDQVRVVALRRFPFAQAKIGEKRIILDEEGNVLSSADSSGGELPWIVGLNGMRSRPEIGLPLRDKEVQIALEILKLFHTARDLSAYHVSKIDVSNLSQINFYISDDLRIIMSEEGIYRQLRMLSLVLPQARAELAKTKYIDLRFKEPILGKK